MTPNQKSINGIQINGEISGIEGFQVTYRESDEEGVLTKSYSNELTFYGDGYNILKAALIDDPNGFVGEVKAEIFDECCGKLVLDGIIRGDSIDWCEPECWITAQVIEKTPELDCLKSTLIYDDHNFFLNRPQKKLRYCVEMRPQFVTEILLQLYFILYLALIPIVFAVAGFIYAWQGIFYIICSAVCIIPGTDCTQDDCNQSEITNPAALWTRVGELMESLSNRLIQCQWYHPTALVRDYIENVCDKCGLTFQSSILNDPASPYYNLLLFSAPVRKGYKPADTEPRLIKDNLPIETVDTLMQRHLKPLFNARYWIVDNVLIFERKDYFQNTNTWIEIGRAHV